jgi:hypothetical protein
MKTKLIYIIFFILLITSAQNYKTIEEVDNACSNLSFSSDEDAEIAVNEMMDIIGLERNWKKQ